MAEMRRSYEGTCIIRKRTSKPQAKRPRGTTPSMKVHALATPNMESSAHEAMSDPPKARYPPKKGRLTATPKRGGLRDKTSNGKSRPATTPASWLCRPPSQTAVRFATITLNQKAGLRRFATSRLSYISSKLERTRRSAQPPRPRARRRWRPTAFRRWREASLPQSPLSGHACPRQPAQASR